MEFEINERDYNWHRLMFEGNTLNFIQPGKIRLVIVNDTPVCIVRKGDELFAVKSKCPHSGGPIQSGWLNEKGDIVCPWHRFSYDLCTGRNTSGEGFYLETFPIKRKEDGIYVGLPRR